jgi:ketosteroid isomerase-like protein
MTDEGTRSLIEQVRSAINAHDLDGFLDCFDEAYESEQPLRRERSFRGRQGVRRNWSANLARVPDLRWDLLDACFSADAAWCEWRWDVTRLDGGRFSVRGVVIYAIADGRIARGRLYMGDLPEHTDAKEER